MHEQKNNTGLRTLLWLAPEIILGGLILLFMALSHLPQQDKMSRVILSVFGGLGGLTTYGYPIAVVLLGVKDSRLSRAARGLQGASALHVVLFFLAHALILGASLLGLCAYAL